MATLKQDKLIGSKSGRQLFNHMSEKIDKVIEDNFTLQQRERELMKEVKKMQKKRKEYLGESTQHVKKLTKTLDRSGSVEKKHHFNRSMASNANEFLMDVQSMRANIEESNRKIGDIRMEIESLRRTHHGQVPSDELIRQNQ